MTVVVSFVKPQGLGSVHAPGVGEVRIRENITIPGSTTASLLNGEVAIVSNAETSMVAAALGTTPDAATTTASAVSQAGVGIGAGQSLTFNGKVGDKVNVKVVT